MKDSQEQLGFFQDTPPTATPKKGKCAGIPIYKVTLVREGKLPCYDQRIRSSAIASTILHTYLADVGIDHFIIILDHKSQVIGLNTVSMGSLTASVVHPREVFSLLY